MRRLLYFILLFFIIIRPGSGLEIKLEPEVAWQGKVISIRIPSSEAVARVDASFLGQRFACYKRGDDYFGVVGIPLDQKPGRYNLALIITQKDGKTEGAVQKVRIWESRFPVSKFWLKPSKKKLMQPVLINQEWGEIEKVLLVEEPKQFWEKKYLKPIAGVISQGFGARQIINGRKSGGHKGVDFGAKVGTRVIAPNYGKVVFVKRLKVFGGTVVLDHGQGVFTLYFHLSKIYPAPGAFVMPGDVIALSGDSGVSSAPHLHWAMSVHNLRVDPMQWVRNEI